MLLRCPSCNTEIRLAGFLCKRRVTPFWCQGCRTIVQLDLENDRVPTSSAAEGDSLFVQQRTVVIADRRCRELRLAAQTLMDEGYRVWVTHDVESALEKVRRELPDLVLVGLRIPERGALAFMREMRNERRTAEIPVAVMSGSYSNRILRVLTRHRAHGFIDKRKIRDTLPFRTRQWMVAKHPS